MDVVQKFFAGFGLAVLVCAFGIALIPGQAFAVPIWLAAETILWFVSEIPTDPAARAKDLAVEIGFAMPGVTSQMGCAMPAMGMAQRCSAGVVVDAALVLVFERVAGALIAAPYARLFVDEVGFCMIASLSRDMYYGPDVDPNAWGRAARQRLALLVAGWSGRDVLAPEFAREVACLVLREFTAHPAGEQVAALAPAVEAHLSNCLRYASRHKRLPRVAPVHVG